MVHELETPSNGAIPEARVVVEQRASIPTAPVVPKKKRNLALGIALGAMLELVWLSSANNSITPSRGQRLWRR